MKNWHFSNFYFFYFITIGIIVPYWSLYLQYLGFSATEIGELMAILLLTKIVTPNIWASIADHVVSKQGNSLGILKYATAVTLVIYCCLYFVDQYWSVALVMFGYCVFWNACLPQVEAATMSHLASHSEGSGVENYGVIRLWGSVGFIFSVLGVGAAVDHVGPMVILLSGAVGLLTVFIASVLLAHYSGSVVNDKQADKAAIIPIRQLLNRRVVVILLLCFFMQLSHAPFYTFFSIYLENYGYSKLQIGLLWSTGVVFEIGVFLIGYRLLKRFSLVHLLSFTFFVAGIRWCLVAQFPDSPMMVFFTQAMHAITYGLYHSVMIQMIDRLFQGRYQIRGQALYSSFTFGLGGALGSVISGYVWAYCGQNVLFMGAGVMMFIVGLASVIVVRRVSI